MAAAETWHPVTPLVDDPDLMASLSDGEGPDDDPAPPAKPAASKPAGPQPGFFERNWGWILLAASLTFLVVLVIVYMYVNRAPADAAAAATAAAARKPALPPDRADSSAVPGGGEDMAALLKTRAAREAQKAAKAAAAPPTAAGLNASLKASRADEPARAEPARTPARPPPGARDDAADTAAADPDAHVIDIGAAPSAPAAAGDDADLAKFADLLDTYEPPAAAEAPPASE